MRHREGRTGLSLVVLFLWLLGGTFVGVSSVPAEDSTVELNSLDVPRQLLSTQSSDNRGKLGSSQGSRGAVDLEVLGETSGMMGVCA